MARTPLQKARLTYLRLGVSVASFLVFVAMNINAVLIAADRSWGLMSILPLGLAYYSLPRRGPTNEIDTPPEEALSPAQAHRLGRIVRATLVLRGAYLVIALFVLLALPRLVTPPT